MRRALAITLVVALPACGPERYDRGGETIAKLAEFKDRMCACTDKTCAERVETDLTAFAADLAADHPPATPVQDAIDKVRQLERRYGDCAGKLTRAPAAGRFTSLFGL